MIYAFIPSFRQVHNQNSRQYTVYRIEVFASGKCRKIERRYRAFHSLHKQLKRFMQTPDFPPKRVRNWNSKVLEQRRLGLENYLKDLLQMKPIPKEVLSFLSLAMTGGTNYSPVDGLVSEQTHQPILTFMPNSYIENTISASGTMSDMVVKGVIFGLYSHEEGIEMFYD